MLTAEERKVLAPGFEPGSKERESFMMGHYTTQAGIFAERPPIFSANRRGESEGQTRK